MRGVRISYLIEHPEYIPQLAQWFFEHWGSVLGEEYAIRAMAQTRAISRVCRSAFGHVVVMIDAELSTTPAEEAGEGSEGAETAAAPRES